MGRAIVREPAVFLFDEPLSNLDAKLRVQMRLEIRKLHHRLGVTSVYVTHDQVEAMTLADRLVVMNEGRAEQIGTPKQVYDRPATMFVAGFIGSPAMNFLPVRLGADGRTAALPEGGRLVLPIGTTLPAGAQVMLGVRPEHLRLGRAGVDALPLVVEVVEELGADTLLHGRLGEQDLVARLSGHAPVRAGDRVDLNFDAAQVHLFDMASRARLGP
jgi:sn-glycerol 3-phosphate transport system ATP-binding protein